MNPLDFRPLSLGEILDRAFTLYRHHFVLFVALAGIPRIPSLALGLFQVQNGPVVLPHQLSSTDIWITLLGIAVALVSYLYAQGGAVIAVSELYLGRSISIGQALRRVTSEILSLFGVAVLNGLAIVGATMLLIIPGLYLACRLLVCIPAALIEQRGPRDSLSRSMALTKGFAGRSALIWIMYVAISIGVGLLVGIPMAAVLEADRADPAAFRAWGSVQAVLNVLVETLLQPIFLIATSIFYYDLRVRKEAFDLQVMMDPDSANVPRTSHRLIVPEER